MGFSNHGNIFNLKRPAYLSIKIYYCNYDRIEWEMYHLKDYMHTLFYPGRINNVSVPYIQYIYCTVNRGIKYDAR